MKKPVRPSILACALLLTAAAAQADTALPSAQSPLAEELSNEVRQLARGATAGAAGARVEVEVGQLDPRLKLAPCQKVQPYLPTGARPWGRTRVGLRCAVGPTPWNVYLPVTVKVFTKSLVAAAPLPAGTVLGARDLAEGEVDIAAAPSPAIADSGLAVGRTLTRALGAGDALRQSDLKARQWFAAGETVQIVAVGAGYAVTSGGQALSPGLEGQAVRVRTESGRIVTGQAVGENRVEITL